MFGDVANLGARFTVHGRTDSYRAVVTLDVQECDDRDHGGSGTSSRSLHIRFVMGADRQ